MASGKQPTSVTGPKNSPSSSNSWNEDEQWMLLPNNLEFNGKAKPPKKQRNKENHRSFVDDSVNISGKFMEDCDPLTFQNIQRSKCNTASWLKDQQDEHNKRMHNFDDEVSSDAEISMSLRGSMNFPGTHAFSVAECPKEIQRHPSQRSGIDSENSKSIKDEYGNEADSSVISERLSRLKDFISEATSFCQELRNANEPLARGEFHKLQQAVKQVADGEREHKALLQQMGTATCSEEHANKCNHLLEKMKQSEERMMALKMQEALLYSMQKRPENKLCVYEDANAQNSDSEPATENNSCPEEPSGHSITPPRHRDGRNQRQWCAEKSLESSCGQQDLRWKDDLQDDSQQITLERIRKQVKCVQQDFSSVNVSASSECDATDVGERYAAAECERKKLKNKLVELQEKKKMNDELLRELSYIKDNEDIGETVRSEEDANCLSQATKCTQSSQLRDKKKADVSLLEADSKLYNLQASLRHLEGIMKSLTGECDMQDISLAVDSVKGPVRLERSLHSAQAAKHDNENKKIRTDFPARRHYEAEGRANEDADMPQASAATGASNLMKLRNHPAFRNKIKEIKMAEQKVKLMYDILKSVQESKRSGMSMSAEHLRFLASFQKGDIFGSDAESITSSDDGKSTTQNLSAQIDSPENFASNVNNNDGIGEILIDTESFEENSHFHDGMTTEKSASACGQSREDAKHNREFDDTLDQRKIAKLQNQLQHLIQMFPPSVRKNDDCIRSSGEGGYTQVKRTSTNIPITSELRHSAHRQDNLQLTRQNVATIGHENQISNSNFHKRQSGSLKKENINNLSRKMSKLSVQNTMNSAFSNGLRGTKTNFDTASTVSSDMNHSRCHSNEKESKALLDGLKHFRKHDMSFNRNQGNRLCSNSSVDSEPLDGSNSAIAADITAAATWGGSSTQDNFEDDLEHTGTAEQDSNNHGLPDNERKSDRCKVSANFPDEFSNSIQNSASVSNVPKRRQENINRMKSELHCDFVSQPLKIRRSNHRAVSSNPLLNRPSAGISSLSSCNSETSENLQKNNTSVFLQQLKNQIDQLSSLCQQQLFQDRPLNVHPMQKCGPNLPNTCPPQLSLSDVAQPCNQQLLLCLTQCYHVLYMQQLEIQHLHRCLRQSIDSEMIPQSSHTGYHNADDAAAFRPCYVPSWATSHMPSNLPSDDQISVMPSGSYIQLPVKPCTTHNTFASVSGTRPVCAVIHPASQENSVQETLNNQVPPRTRANNFWDNFRSYSRQNLLSNSSNSKQNGNVSLPVAPQIRHIHPLVSTNSTNRATEISNSYSSPPAQAELNRSVPNAEVQDLMNIWKKSNSNSPVAVTANYRSTDLQKIPVSANVNSTCLKVLKPNRHVENPETPVTSPNSGPSSINLIQLHPIQSDSKIGSSSICPSASDSLMARSPDVLSVSQTDEESEFLKGLIHEAQRLQSDALQQKALKVIRGLAEKENSSESHQKILNDHSYASHKVESAVHPLTSQSTESSLRSPESADFEKSVSRSQTDSNISWSNQNLPTAAIPPINKNVTQRSVSTGAVRKKSKTVGASLLDSLPNGHSSAHMPLECEQTIENCIDNSPLQKPSSRNMPDLSGNVIDSLILDLKYALPFGQRFKDDSPEFWSNVVSTIILDTIKSRICISHKALSSFRLALEDFLSRFIGVRFCDCEPNFLKFVGEFLHANLSALLPVGNSSLDVLDVTQPLDENIQELSENPMDEDICMRVTLEENDALMFKASLQSNIVLQNTATNSDNLHSNVIENVAGEFSLEPEAEPEVEAGTEADLAEADQSPGQQANALSSSSLPTSDICSLDVGRIEETSEITDNNEIVCGTGVFEEASLDSIPTKLHPNSEEEVQRQLKDEQACMPFSDDVFENNESVVENASDNELVNKK